MKPTTKLALLLVVLGTAGCIVDPYGGYREGYGGGRGYADQRHPYGGQAQYGHPYGGQPEYGRRVWQN